MRTRKKSRGVLLTDLIVGMVMAIALLMALTVAVSTLHRGERQLSDQRSAARRLEAALWTMQSGGTVDADIAVEKLPADRASGRVWVRVSLAVPGNGRGQSLVGLVPADRVAEGGGR